MVQEAVRTWRDATKEVFVPLSHPPGEAQVEFGFAYVDVAGERQQVALFVDELREGGFTARAVGESIFTGADILDKLRASVRPAVECHFDEGRAPELIRLDIVRDEIVTP